jgi:hypothetical protein
MPARPSLRRAFRISAHQIRNVRLASVALRSTALIFGNQLRPRSDLRGVSAPFAAATSAGSFFTNPRGPTSSRITGESMPLPAASTPAETNRLQSLIAAGKIPKVAITAVMRKLIVLANALLKAASAPFARRSCAGRQAPPQRGRGLIPQARLGPRKAWPRYAPDFAQSDNSVSRPVGTSLVLRETIWYA